MKPIGVSQVAVDFSHSFKTPLAVEAQHVTLIEAN